LTSARRCWIPGRSRRSCPMLRSVSFHQGFEDAR
jgi:hypothetical protein